MSAVAASGPRTLGGALVTLRGALAVAGLVSASLVAGAWFFELAIGLRPCKLCLEQRLPHYLVMVLVPMALASGDRRVRLAGVAAAAPLMAFAAYLGAFHAGVEWGWWLGPSDCGGRAAALPPTVGGLLGQLETARVVSCTEAAWRLAGLSLAGWNALASFGASAVLFGALAAHAMGLRASAPAGR